jgi:hypothetical protein
MKQSQTLGSFRVRARVFRHNDIISVGVEPLLALLRGQNYISSDDELRSRQFLLADVNYLCVAMHEKHADGPASMRSRRLAGRSPWIRL